jgi:hypothetical protein
MHPTHGMGIEFPARTEEQRKSVGDFIEFLTTQPGAKPELEISPRALVASAEELNATTEPSAESEDPLLDLLRRGSVLEQLQFLEDLHSQRNSTEVSQ